MTADRLDPLEAWDFTAHGADAVQEMWQHADKTGHGGAVKDVIEAGDALAAALREAREATGINARAVEFFKDAFKRVTGRAERAEARVAALEAAAHLMFAVMDATGRWDVASDPLRAVLTGEPGT